MKLIKLDSRRKRHLSSYAYQENWGVWGGKEAQEGEDMYILMTNSHCCMSETNKTL